ncbi:MAG: electron transfer flavoprotein subunit alpha/FixB family protein [Actinomycetota bacterium]|nr:electron transfer flavoprotein subunit alpha/FixB family protein [Actinomycetota bacterium]
MKTLIIGEVVNNELSTGTLEIISKASELDLNYSVVTIGSSDVSMIGSEEFSNTYLKSNPDKLNLSNSANEIKSIIDENEIKLVLSNSSYIGRDIIAFLSVDFKTSPVSNVSNFEISDSTVKTFNTINGGESEYIAEINSEIKFLLIRPKSFDQNDIKLTNNFEIKDVSNDDNTIEVFDIHIEEKTGPQLEDSKIVVAAGRGMVEVENLSLINDLAQKLNAAIGGTRAIVDSGWMPYSNQVGQTGKTVKPDVYIACGISGATQHQVGMKDSKFIIAINKDEEAPIFQISDLGIVGDTLTVIPKLIENL